MLDLISDSYVTKTANAYIPRILVRESPSCWMLLEFSTYISESLEFRFELTLPFVLQLQV